MEISHLLTGSSQHRNSVKIAIILLTLVMGTLGVFNLISQGSSQLKTDGVHWVFSEGNLIADSVPQNSAGDAAGIEPGDRLISVNLRIVHFPQDVGKILRD